MGQNTFLEVSSSYFHMHWPSTWSDEFNALPAEQQHSTTFNIDSGVYIDGPEPTGQRFRDSYRYQTNIGVTRYLDASPWRQPSAENGIRELVRLGHRRLPDLQRHAPPLQRPGATCNATVQTGCVPNEVWAFGTPLVQEAKMRNFAGFVQDRLSYERFTVNLGLRWSYYDGKIPEQQGGGGRWFPVTTYPEVDPGYAWNTLAPRTGLVWKITSDGKNVAKASYSRYYEVMYTDEFSNVNPNTISTTNIPIVYTWLGDLNRNGLVENNELGPIKSQYVPRANAIDPDLRNPKNDEIMFAFQREVMNNVSFSVDWIQRWFNDATVNQNCFGLPCSDVPTTVYTPTRVVTDAGPDNILNTGNEQQVTYYDVAAAYRGRDSFIHTNCGNNVSVELHAALQGARAHDEQAHVESLAGAGLVRVVAAGWRHRARLHRSE